MMQTQQRPRRTPILVPVKAFYQISDLVKATGLRRREAEPYFKPPSFSLSKDEFEEAVLQVRAQLRAENAFQIEPQD